MGRLAQSETRVPRSTVREFEQQSKIIKEEGQKRNLKQQLSDKQPAVKENREGGSDRKNERARERERERKRERDRDTPWRLTRRPGPRSKRRRERVRE